MILNFQERSALKRNSDYQIIVDLKSEGEIDFNSFSIGLNNDSLLVSDVRGNLLISNNILAKNLKFLYKGQRISVDGEFRNLLQWLDGRPVQMIAQQMYHSTD